MSKVQCAAYLMLPLLTPETQAAREQQSLPDGRLRRVNLQAGGCNTLSVHLDSNTSRPHSAHS